MNLLNDYKKFMAIGAGAAGMVAATPEDAEALNVGALAKNWRGLSGKFTSMADRRIRAEIADNLANLKYKTNYERWKLATENPTGKTLGDIYDHELLYKSYPDFKNIKIEFTDKTKTADIASRLIGSKKGINGENLTIRINPNHFLRNPEKTLLHEIQHAIQIKQGWAGGASPFEQELLFSNTSKKRALDRNVNNAQAALNLKSHVKDYVNKPGNSKEEWQKYADDILEGFGVAITPEQINLARTKSFGELNRTLSRSKDALQEETPYMRYLRHAGEIEARDASARMMLTAEQRSGIAPYSSEEMPLSKWLVAPEGKPQLQEAMPPKGYYNPKQKTMYTSILNAWDNLNPASKLNMRGMRQYNPRQLASAMAISGVPTANQETLQSTWSDPGQLAAAVATGGATMWGKAATVGIEALVGTGLEFMPELTEQFSKGYTSSNQTGVRQGFF